jgi:RimJ/RimL family protein N-acetyltransferase/predicted N-acetyltransferase YhbS
MRIVPLEPEHLPIVTPLLFRAVAGSDGAFPSENALTDELSSAISLGRRSPWCVLVADDEGGVQGVAASGPVLPATSRSRPGDSELRMLAAMPDGPGRRLGARLLEEMRKELRTRGATALWARGRDTALGALTSAGAVVVSSQGERAMVRLQVSAWPEELETERLVLRNWHPHDRQPFAELNRHPEVTRFLPGPLTSDESDVLLDHFQGELTRSGFGHWALAEKGATGTKFVGFVGLSATVDLPFSPLPELSYRLLPEAWGKGYATEACQALIRYARDLGFTELVSFTVPANQRSRNVMQRLGMRRDESGDFEHPRLAVGHPLRSHVLYRLKLSATPYSGAHLK